MPKRERKLPVVECKHVEDPTLWRRCKGTTLKECVLCYTLEDVNEDRIDG